MSDRQQLLFRVRKRYDITTQRVTIGRFDFEFTRVTDPDKVLDRVAEEEDRRTKLEGKRRPDDELHLPYWAQLWDAAFGLGSYFAENFESLFPGGRSTSGAAPLQVLDLGCGMGMTGSVAAALGCKVLFADLEPDALVFARLNSLPWSDRVRTRRLNWRSDTLNQQFDLILGADILYERVQWPFLEPFWRAHLAPGGTILIGEPGRQSGELFVDWIKPHPWVLEERRQSIPDRPRPIRVFKLNRA